MTAGDGGAAVRRDRRGAGRRAHRRRRHLGRHRGRLGRARPGRAAAGGPRRAPGRLRRRPAPPDAAVAGRASSRTACWPARCCWPRSTSSTARSTCTPAGRCATWSTSAWSRSSTRTTPWPTRRSASATTTAWPRWSRTWSARSCSSCSPTRPASSRPTRGATREASLIEEVVEIDQQLERLAGGPGSAVGSGGMASKLAAAKIATWSGVQTVIADAGRPGRAGGGPGRTRPGVGTVFRARESRLSARKLWIAFALGVARQPHRRRRGAGGADRARPLAPGGRGDRRRPAASGPTTPSRSPAPTARSSPRAWSGCTPSGPTSGWGGAARSSSIETTWSL